MTREQKAKAWFALGYTSAYIEKNEFGKWIYIEWSDGQSNEFNYDRNNTIIFAYIKSLDEINFMNIIIK